ncbi:MAG: MarR family winged helix-turn-helix transcriptional regulator [Xanthobacteraceae bacterium]|jgi:DNA-binding MarR family transcriptional regulator
MPISRVKTKNEAARPSAAPGAPRWHGIPAAAARRFHQISAARVGTVVGEHGLTSLQWGALQHLSWIAENTGLEQNILAARLNVDRNTASVVVEQLVKLGLAARRVNGADRRSRLLSLTASGKKLYATLRPTVDAANAELLAPLPPRERKQFMDLLIRVVEGNLVHQKSPPRRRRRNLSHPPGA